VYIPNNTIYVGTEGKGNSNLKEKVPISIEVDMNNHKIYFFGDNKQIPFCVRGVPKTVYFAVYYYHYYYYILFRYQERIK
jgi:hypothetical protein